MTDLVFNPLPFTGSIGTKHAIHAPKGNPDKFNYHVNPVHHTGQVARLDADKDIHTSEIGMHQNLGQMMRVVL